MKKCLKCGHTNHADNALPTDPCPNCGAVYAKVEQAIKRSQQSVDDKKREEVEQQQRERQEAARLAKERRDAKAAKREAERQQRLERLRENAKDFRDENIAFHFQDSAVSGIINFLRFFLYFIFAAVVLIFTIAGYAAWGMPGLMTGMIFGLVFGVSITGFGFLFLNINDRLNNIQIILAEQVANAGGDAD